MIFIDEQTEAILVSIHGGNIRPVEQLSTENTVLGPRDSFTENLKTNTSLIRRKVRSSRLKIEMMTVGDVTQTDIAIAYMKEITNETTVQEIKSRIHNIQTDVVLESGYIEQLIEERTFSPFSQFLITERPYYLVSALLQGK